MNTIVTVGRIVHYFDREAIVNADATKRVAEPYAAIVTRVHRGADGAPTDLVNLHVLDPEVGAQIARDVSFGGSYGEVGDGKPEANRWYWPPIQKGNTPAALQPTPHGSNGNGGIPIAPATPPDTSSGGILPPPGDTDHSASSDPVGEPAGVPGEVIDAEVPAAGDDDEGPEDVAKSDDKAKGSSRKKK